MTAKVVLLFCAQALLAKDISCQCNGFANNGLAWEGSGAPWRVGPRNVVLPYATEANFAAAPCGTPFAATERIVLSSAPLAASNGGGFPITSASPIIPTGLFMTSKNEYEGPLVVSGAVPFLGALGLEGVLPTTGTGAVTYGCGNGNVGMVTEDITAGFNGYGSYGYGLGINAAELGYGYPGLTCESGIAGSGYGYGFNRGCGFPMY